MAALYLTVSTLKDWAGIAVVLVGLAAVWAIDRFYGLLGRLDDRETEHWD